MYLGTYVISLHAIDKAGNIGTTSSFFTVFDTTGIPSIKILNRITELIQDHPVKVVLVLVVLVLVVLVLVVLVLVVL